LKQLAAFGTGMVAVGTDFLFKHINLTIVRCWLVTTLGKLLQPAMQYTYVRWVICFSIGRIHLPLIHYRQPPSVRMINKGENIICIVFFLVNWQHLAQGGSGWHS